MTTQTIEALYQNALLADAAYVNWARSENENEATDEGNENFRIRITGELEARGFTNVQADAFFVRYKVLSVSEDSSSGFSATLFFDSTLNKQALGIRGTETSQGGADFFEDLRLILFPGGVASTQFEDLKEFIASSNIQGSINVAGHSLGGHLTTLLTLALESTELDPRLEGIEVNQGYSYNGLGFGTSFLGAGIVELFDRLIPGEFNINNDRLTNIFSTAGLEFAAGLGITVGGIVPIFTENQDSAFGAIENHFIRYLTDSLSVYRILDRIQPIQTESDFMKVHEILDGTSANPTETLQTIINDVGKLFNIDAGLRDTEMTDEFLMTLDGVIQGFPAGTQFQFNKLVDMNTRIGDVNTIFAQAFEDSTLGMAYRYALQELDPFVIEVQNASGVFDEAATASLYAVHNPGNRLALENFSNEYLDDRSQLLFEKLRLGLNDPDPEIDGSFRTLTNLNERRIYEDRETNLTIDLFPRSAISGDGIPNLARLSPGYFIFGSDENEQAAAALTGGEENDHLYGGGGNDDLIGDTGADILEGNSGDDTLFGGKEDKTDDDAPDVLRGGAGVDTYYVGKGDKVEDDAEGEGIIKYQNSDNNEVTVSGRSYVLKQENIYESNEANPVDRLKIAFDSASNTLTVLGETSFTILNFQSGQFNINADRGKNQIDGLKWRSAA